MPSLGHTLSHTLGHTLGYCTAVQHCGFIQAKQALEARAPLASIPRQPQRPSKAPKRPSKARKSPHLGQRIARTLKARQGPLNRLLYPRHTRAKPALDSPLRAG